MKAGRKGLLKKTEGKTLVTAFNAPVNVEPQGREGRMGRWGKGMA